MPAAFASPWAPSSRLLWPGNPAGEINFCLFANQEAESTLTSKLGLWGYLGCESESLGIQIPASGQVSVFSSWKCEKARFGPEFPGAPGAGVGGCGEGTAFPSRPSVRLTSSIHAEATVAGRDTFIKAGSSELEVIGYNYSWRHRSPWPDSGKCGCYKVWSAMSVACITHLCPTR